MIGTVLTRNATVSLAFKRLGFKLVSIHGEFIVVKKHGITYKFKMKDDSSVILVDSDDRWIDDEFVKLTGRR